VPQKSPCSSGVPLHDLKPRIWCAVRAQKFTGPIFCDKKILTIMLINPNTILQRINRRKKFRMTHSLCKKLIIV
jgi:hypothetical protein